VFYLYSGVRNQALALAAFASKGQGVKKRRVVIVRSVDTRSGEIAELVKQAGSAAGWSRVEEALVDGVQSNLSALVNKLKNSGAEVIIFLGPPGAEAAFLREAQSASWSPIFLVPGSLVGGSIFDAPAAFDGRIFIAYPTLPTDRSPDALAEYRRLAEAHRLDARHLTIQLTALSSAKILVEALKRAGRDLSRAKLIESLEALYQFRTGLTPAVTFGPNRRVGATGAYVVSVDLKEKTFVPVSDWIQIN
jgi:ABC-type branched-subunit amino acid transport system substrate-binding protein